MADMPAAGQDGLVGSAGGPRADRPKRRRFTAAYKMEILAEYDKLTDSVERGALLRREGLYHSHVQQWRAARDQGALQALTDKPTGRPTPSRRNHVANDASPHEARAAQCSYYEQRAAHASPPPVQAAFAVQARVCR